MRNKNLRIVAYFKTSSTDMLGQRDVRGLSAAFPILHISLHTMPKDVGMPSLQMLVTPPPPRVATPPSFCKGITQHILARLGLMVQLQV